jgi:hypothetical protein
MKVAALLTTLAAALVAVLATILPATAAASAATCGSGANGSPGYAYAGHQSASISHGIRATITPTRKPSIANGHVAGWIGVGGPRQGPNGETMWLQTGIAGIPGMGLVVYAEITRPGADPVFIPLAENVSPGQSVKLAVLEVSRRPDYWRVWLNGQAATQPIHLRGSTKQWKPIATAESFNGNAGACNTFGFRFEQVGLARSKGGTWRTFQPGFRFLDRGFTVRELRPASGQRTLSADAVEPYAFEAASA